MSWYAEAKKFYDEFNNEREISSWNDFSKTGKTKNNFEVIAAAGMGRLLSHMMGGDFAVISAERYGMSEEEKKEANTKLKEIIRQLGFGFVDTKGAWFEEGQLLGENSLFVPGISPDLAKEIGKKFDQQQVLIGNEGNFKFIDLENDSVDDEGDLLTRLRIPKMDDVGPFFTSINGKNQRFEIIPDKAIDEITPNQREFNERLRELGLKNPWKKSLPKENGEGEEWMREPSIFSPGKMSSILGKYRKFANKSEIPDSGKHCLIFYRYSKGDGILRRSGMVIAKEGGSTLSKRFEGDFEIYLPFVATLIETFDSSSDWVKATSEGKFVKQSQKKVSPQDYEEALAKHSDFYGKATDFEGRPIGKNMKGFDSLFIGPLGNVFQLMPHQHNQVSKNVMRSLNPEETPMGKDWGHQDLSNASGAVRFQVYRDGMGVTINMNNPPNLSQLNAIREMYKQTPMERFIAEITFDGEIIAHLTSFSQLANFVNQFNPADPTAVDVLSDVIERGSLFDRFI